MMRRAPRSTLFPDTSLFRSELLVELITSCNVHWYKVVGKPRFFQDDSYLLAVWSRPVVEVYRLRHVFSLLGGFRSSLRSEEHTSELQSRQYPVCRLLLEKKN